MIGLDEKGTIVLREKVSRGRVTTRLVNVPPCLIGIEAGMATHYMARELLALGHDVKQVPPAYARPFRQGHKNDLRDAQAGRGSCATPFDALRADKDRRSTGPAGAAPRAFSPDRGSDSCDQSDSVAFFWNTAFQCGRDLASCGNSYRRYWPRAPMCYRPEW